MIWFSILHDPPWCLAPARIAAGRCATPYACKLQSSCCQRCSMGCGSVRKEYLFICSITHFSLCPFPKENLKVLSLLHFHEQGPYQLGSFGCPGQRQDIRDLVSLLRSCGSIFVLSFSHNCQWDRGQDTCMSASTTRTKSKDVVTTCHTLSQMRNEMQLSHHRISQMRSSNVSTLSVPIIHIIRQLTLAQAVKKIMVSLIKGKKKERHTHSPATNFGQNIGLILLQYLIQVFPEKCQQCTP